MIKPGGDVPWHSHGDRPAMIYIVKGEITEYASNCAVPIVHKAGDVSPETQRHLALVEEHRQEDVVLVRRTSSREDKDDAHMM